MHGIFNIVPTPFDESGAVDERSLRRLIDFVIDTGVDGLTILGFLGEAAKLSEAERSQVIDITVEVADGRVPVVVGATAAATDPGVAYARDAVSRGAAGLLVAPPRMARPNEAAVRRHYETLAEVVDVPIVVQDFPASSGVFMTPAFIGRLAADVPSCRYLKLEDDPTAQKVTAILAANADVRIFGGLGGNFMLEELQRGAVGMMTGFGFPEILVSIYRDFRAGEVDKARDTFYRYLPLDPLREPARTEPAPAQAHLHETWRHGPRGATSAVPAARRCDPRWSSTRSWPTWAWPHRARSSSIEGCRPCVLRSRSARRMT